MTNQPSEKGRLSSAQRDALSVLAETGKRVRGGKRASRLEPIPLVNTRAAFSLCERGLARMSLHDRGPFSSGYDFTITEKGRGQS